ncbi:MAG TPA: hypothetical protein ENI95_13140, partial [Chloroflexi bacterium]|nr:hypothetical protein [Chloroflexota bacterium]
MICNAPGRDHGWVHLSISHDRPAPPPWALRFGYPSDEHPTQCLAGVIGFGLPDGVSVMEWKAELYAALLIPAETHPEEIARL